MNTAEVTKEVVKVLSAHLLAEMASITSVDQITEEWPEANKEMLQYPLISIITTAPPDYTPHIGFSEDSSVVNGSDPKSRDFKFDIGQYDFTFQLDLWTDYKLKRHTLYQEFFTAFNKNLVEQGYPGLTLTMADYHDQPVHFQMVSYNYGDSEEASQRKEWRVKIELIANCEAIFEATKKAIIETEQVTEIGQDIKIE